MLIKDKTSLNADTLFSTFLTHKTVTTGRRWMMNYLDCGGFLIKFNKMKKKE